MKTIKKAQTGVVVPKKNEKEEFTYLRKSEKAASAKAFKSKVKPKEMMPKPKIKVKAKSGGSFPDLNKDGKITKADILKGRGVIAKSGAKMAKCKTGCK